jgi:alpha-1,6-mannosyltransferase
MSVHSPLGAAPRAGTIEFGSRLPAETRPAIAAALARLALGGLLATMLIVVAAAPGTAALLPQTVQPVPPALAGPFGALGFSLATVPLLLVLAAMLGSYAAAVKLSERLSIRAVLATIVALNVLVLLAPPLFSTDVFSYEAYARMWAEYAVNPYVHGPHSIALDPIYPFIGADWIFTPTAYGPLFTLLSGAFASLGVAAGVLAYKSLAALGGLLCVIFTIKAARLRGTDPVRAAALVGLNPLLVLYGVGGSHNDLLMLGVASIGVYLLLAGRLRAGAAGVTVAAAVKATAVLLLPFALAARAEQASARRRQILIGTVAAGAVLAAISFAMFGSGTLSLPGTLISSQGAGDWHSIPGFIALRLGFGGLGHPTGIVLGVISLGTILWLLRAVAAGRLEWIEGAAWATVAILVCASSLLPWYVGWLLPLVALVHERRLWRAALWMTAIVMTLQALGYIPHSTTTMIL